MNSFFARSSVALALALSSHAPGAQTYTFAPVTSTSATNDAAALAQLSMIVDSVSPTQVSFTFHNVGLAALSITDAFIDGTALASISSITNGSGVDFAPSSSPPNLPGGNLCSPAFSAVGTLSVGAAPPSQPNGVNPGETATVIYNLAAGESYSSVIAALNTPGDHLRVGIHVQGFSDGGSESFVTPAPSSGLVILALSSAFAARRRR